MNTQIHPCGCITQRRLLGSLNQIFCGNDYCKFDTEGKHRKNPRSRDAATSVNSAAKHSPQAAAKAKLKWSGPTP